VNATIFDSFFHSHGRGRTSDHGCGHGHKGNFNETFYH